MPEPHTSLSTTRDAKKYFASSPPGDKLPVGINASSSGVLHGPIPAKRYLDVP